MANPEIENYIGQPIHRSRWAAIIKREVEMSLGEEPGPMFESFVIAMGVYERLKAGTYEQPDPTPEEFYEDYHDMIERGLRRASLSSFTLRTAVSHEETRTAIIRAICREIYPAIKGGKHGEDDRGRHPDDQGRADDPARGGYRGRGHAP